MPLSIVIHGRLRAILRSRIAIANKYVQRIFVDEYKIVDHFVNLQRVFFFGAGDLMLTFYSKLFMSVCEVELVFCLLLTQFRYILNDILFNRSYR